MNTTGILPAERIFETRFWEAVKTKKGHDATVSYLDLGGTSLGIFLFTESVKKELGIEVPPEALLESDASLANLKLTYLKA